MVNSVNLAHTVEDRLMARWTVPESSRKIMDSAMFDDDLLDYCTDCKHFQMDISSEGITGYGCCHPIFNCVNDKTQPFLVSEDEVKESNYLFIRPDHCPVYLSRKFAEDNKIIKRDDNSITTSDVFFDEVSELLGQMFRDSKYEE